MTLRIQKDRMAIYDIPGKLGKATKVVGLAVITSLFYKHNRSGNDLFPGLLSLGTYLIPGVRGTLDIVGQTLGDIIESTTDTINITGRTIKDSTKDITKAMLSGTMIFKDLVD